MPSFLMRLAPVFLVLVGSLTAALADNTASLTGVWAGTGVQGEHTWSMRVTFTPDRIRIEYPSLECGGTWEPASHDGGKENEVYFHERLEYGHHACHADGFVKIKITPSGMAYEWSRAVGSAVEATALLQPHGN